MTLMSCQTVKKSTLAGTPMFASLTNADANICVATESPFNQRTLYGDIPYPKERCVPIP